MTDKELALRGEAEEGSPGTQMLEQTEEVGETKSLVAGV